MPSRSYQGIFVMVSLFSIMLIMTLWILTARLTAGNKVFGEEGFDGFIAPPDHYNNAAIATEHPRCSQLARWVMEEAGGNGVDAGIIALLCIGIINNYSSGIGGGGFMLVRINKEGLDEESELIDFRERAPKKAHQDMFNKNPETAREGGLAVAVPGEIAGMWYAHQKYGNFPWKDLFEVAAKLADGGFAITPSLHTLIKKNQRGFSKYPALASLYLDQDGDALPIGHWLQRPNLAKTLRTIGREGPGAFYNKNSWIAQSLVRTVQETGGVMSLQDLEDYEVITRPTIKVPILGGKKWLITGGAPTGGPVLAQALNMLYPSEEEMTHTTLIEVLKFAYAGRMQLGDPDYGPEIRFIENALVSVDKATTLRELFVDTLEETQNPNYYLNHLKEVLFSNEDDEKPEQLSIGFSRLGKHGTTHVSILDEIHGMAVSVTSTVNLEFGCLVLDPVTGILLNSEMDDFSIPGHENAFLLPPTTINYVQGGKRPQSSAVPLMIVDDKGELEIVAGGTGGSRIISTAIQLLALLFDQEQRELKGVALWSLCTNQQLSSMVCKPRLHHQLIPNEVLLEMDYPRNFKEQLVEMGHKIKEIEDRDIYLAAIQVIMRRNSVDCTMEGERNQKQKYILLAAADGRKNGAADGF